MYLGTVHSLFIKFIYKMGTAATLRQALQQAQDKLRVGYFLLTR